VPPTPAQPPPGAPTPGAHDDEVWTEVLGAKSYAAARETGAIGQT
jgi:hypothetical protein